ncbi:MAG: 3'-5' exonuclease [Candidatus Aenigmatarchaeota archaeon]
MKEGYLLDIQSSRGKDPYIELFLKNEDGMDIIEDRDYEQEFWVMPGSSGNVKKLREDIEKISDLSPEHVNKWYRGRKRSMLELSVGMNERSSAVDKINNRVPGFKNFIGVSPRGGRSFTNDYLIKNKLRPFNYVSLENGEHKTERKPVFKPSLGFLDIEVYNKGKMPDVENPDLPIVSISYITYDRDKDEIINKKTLTHSKKSDYDFVETLDSEEDMISRTVDLINDEDMDFEFGYNSDEFDWKYIINRSESLGIKDELKLGRDGSKIKRIRGGLGFIPHMNGKVNIDLMQMVSRMYNFPNNKMSTVVKSTIGREKNEIGSRIHEYWDNPSLSDEFFEYSIGDVEDLKDLTLKLEIPETIIYGSLFTGMRPEYLTRKSSPDIIDELSQRKAYYFKKDLGENTVLTSPNGTDKKVEMINNFSILKESGRFENASIFSTSDIHFKTLSKLKEREGGVFAGPVSWVADSINRKLDKSWGGWKQFLKFLSLGVPHTLISDNYNWHGGREEEMAGKYIDEFEKQLEKIDELVYTDSDCLYMTSESSNADVPSTPLVATNEGEIIYLDEGLLNSDGIKLTTKNNVLDRIVEKSCETLLNRGPEEGLMVTRVELDKMDQLPKEDLFFDKILTKDPKKYSTDKDVAIVGRELNKKKNETVKHSYRNGEPIPFDFMEEGDLDRDPFKRKIVGILERIYSPFYDDFAERVL